MAPSRIAGSLSRLCVSAPPSARIGRNALRSVWVAPGQMLSYRQELHLVRDGVIAHRSRSTVTLEIRDRSACGWLARWTSSGGELLEADPRLRPALEIMQAIWDGVAIDLLLDDGGRVAGLADQAAVRALGAVS